MKAYVLSLKMNHISPRRLYPWKKKILKGLTLLESSFSSSDVGKKEKQNEEKHVHLINIIYLLVWYNI
jgi:hypothetical protein